MNKKRMAVIFPLLLLAYSSVCAATVKILPFDFKQDKVHIQITLDDKRIQEATLLVADTAANLDSLSEGEGSFRQIADVVSDENGFVDYSFKFHRNPLDVLRQYTVYVKDNVHEQAITATMYIAGTNDIESMITYINGIGVLTDEKLMECIKVFSLDNFSPCAYADLQPLKDAILAGKPYSSGDADKIQRIICEASVLNCYKKNAAEEIYGTNFTLENADIIGLDKMTDNTFYEVYNNILNNSGRKKVIDSLVGKEYQSTEQLRKEFGKAVLINGINNTDSSGGGHISSIITSQNAAYAELFKNDLTSLNRYLGNAKIDTVNSRLRTASISSISEIESNINSIITALSNEISGGGISGGGAGGGGTSGGNTSAGTAGAEVSPGPFSSASNMAGTGQVAGNTGTFADVDNSHWACKAIESLYENKIISGYSDKTFHPEAYISREEIAKMLCTAFELKEQKTEEILQDINTEEWYYPYVTKCLSSGVITGMGNNRFGIGELVLREDFVVMLYRIMGSPAYKDKAVFKDSDKISDYAVDAASYMKEKGIVSGYGDMTFRPKNPLTRAEVASLIYKITMEGK